MLTALLTFCLLFLIIVRKYLNVMYLTLSHALVTLFPRILSIET
jgi:hypothetical protein